MFCVDAFGYIAPQWIVGQIVGEQTGEFNIINSFLNFRRAFRPSGTAKPLRHCMTDPFHISDRKHSVIVFHFLRRAIAIPAHIVCISGIRIAYLQSAAPFLSAKRALDLVRENQQSSVHNFVKDFSLLFPKICRLCPLKKGAATENPLEYGKAEVQILFESLQAAISSMELPKNFENKKLPNPLR